MAEKRKAPPTAFKPGTSGNPGGRPKSSLGKALAELGEKKAGGQTNAQRLAQVAWEKAIAGDLDWANFLADRILGKPAQAVDLQSGGAPMAFTLSLSGGEGGQ